MEISNSKTCNICEQPMKRRMKYTGEDAGIEFWVCSRFPECRNVERCDDETKRPDLERGKAVDSKKTESFKRFKAGDEETKVIVEKETEKDSGYYTKMATLVFSAVLFAFVFTNYVNLNLAGMIFGEIGKRSTDTGLIDYPKEQNAVVQPVQVPVAVESYIQPQEETPRTGAFYTYTDKSGVVAIVNDIEKVPSLYRSSMKVSGESNVHSTAVIIKNNQIHVPVTINYQGQTVSVYLKLDTGATEIVISPAIAKRLGIREEATRKGISTIADGSRVVTKIAPADFVTVGNKAKSQIDLHIIPRAGNEETGLLGMSFLGDFPHMIDMKAQVIKWM